MVGGMGHTAIVASSFSKFSRTLPIVLFIIIFLYLFVLYGLSSMLTSFSCNVDKFIAAFNNEELVVNN